MPPPFRTRRGEGSGLLGVRGGGLVGDRGFGGGRLGDRSLSDNLGLLGVGDLLGLGGGLDLGGRSLGVVGLLLALEQVALPRGERLARSLVTLGGLAGDRNGR